MTIRLCCTSKSSTLIKSPKSTAFPVVAIVINSIEFDHLQEQVYLPPANTPRVLFDAPPLDCLIASKSPKSVAFPVVAIVKKSIIISCWENQTSHSHQQLHESFELPDSPGSMSLLS